MSDFRDRYFNVKEPLELSVEEFNEEWAHVDSIWTRLNGNKRQNGDEWKSYVCRLSKPQILSGRKEGVLSENLRTTWK